MIDTRPDITARHLAFQVLAAGGLELRGCLPGPWPLWPWTEGVNLLLRWSGARLPLPRLGDPDTRQYEIVGWATADAVTILTFAGVAHAADTVYHYVVVQVGGGGVVNRPRSFEIVTRTFDSGDTLRDLMPNTPSQLDARLLPSDKPHVTWWYSAVRQQVAPATFNVYVTDGVSGFDYNSPAGSVNYVAGQSRYDWTGTVLSADDVRYYTVRAESAGSVLSLIPQLGLCPSGDYDSVDLARCPQVLVPAGPPATIDDFWPEVVP